MKPVAPSSAISAPRGVNALTVPLRMSPTRTLTMMSNDLTCFAPTVDLKVGGAVRSYGFVPSTVDGAPLVVVLHGNDPSARGSMMREWTTFDRHAGERGWAVAYPDGYAGSWADGRGVTRADDAGVDDVAFLT